MVLKTAGNQENHFKTGQEGWSIWWKCDKTLCLYQWWSGKISNCKMGQDKLTAPLSAFHNVLSATFCPKVTLAWELLSTPIMTLASYQQAGGWGKRRVAESTLMLAESRAVDLPWPLQNYTWMVNVNDKWHKTKLKLKFKSFKRYLFKTSEY